MRRGNKFEAQINKVVEYVLSQGYEAHKNYANRTVDGTYIKGEPFDFEIFIKGLWLCFDAKECHSKRWQLTNAKPEQVYHLLRCKKAGFDAFFYVYFVEDKKLVKFDAEYINNLIIKKYKSVSADDGVVYDLGKEVLNAIRGNCEQI